MQISTLSGARPRTPFPPIPAPETVLVVDDDAAVCRLMELAVELGGRDAVRAGSAREALEVLRVHRVALIVTDVQMPNASGLDLLAALSATIDPPPVLVVTGQPDPATIRAAGLLGARKVIAKPFSLEELGREIDDALSDPVVRLPADARLG